MLDQLVFVFKNKVIYFIFKNLPLYLLSGRVVVTKQHLYELLFGVGERTLHKTLLPLSVDFYKEQRVGYLLKNSFWMRLFAHSKHRVYYSFLINISPTLNRILGLTINK